MDPKARIPITYKALTGEEEQQIETAFGNRIQFIEANPGNVLISSSFAEVGERIQNFQVRPEDIWILAYPRTGSNWVEEMVWLIGNNLNFEEAKKTLIYHRSILLEESAISGHLNAEWSTKPEFTIELAKSTKSPRQIKSHLLLNFLPAGLDTVKPKIVYVARNPKDTCVSYYMLLRMTLNMQIPLEVFCEEFMKGRAPCGQYLHHVLTYWKLREQPNVLFLKYEDMKKDLKEVIQKTATFLGKNYSDAEVNQLADHLSFQKMSNNRAVNREGMIEALVGPDYKSKLAYGFLRKGEVGDWKNHMSPEMIAKFDAWIEESLKGTGLGFD